MRIFSRKTIKAFWGNEPLSESALKAWYEVVEKATWNNHNELKEQFRNASKTTIEWFLIFMAINLGLSLTLNTDPNGFSLFG
jgi:mRNA-degrading endonuclease HigB of HigAB toxin-antitoxin module